MGKIPGSMEALSAMQLTVDTAGLDAECKTLLRSKEVLAVILQGTVEEYKGYSLKEIMDFIETDSFEEGKEVSPGRTNSQVSGENVEFVQLNEKVTFFDMVFKAKNPLLSSEKLLVNLHFDLEPQKTYRPGYPIEKRGFYYLARRLSAQLSLVTDATDYGELEKCYGIWICRDDVPEDDRYSISFYEIANTKNIGSCDVKKENFDLMNLVVIRLGDKVYNEKYRGKEKNEGNGSTEGDEGHRLLRFLNAIMYPHSGEFMDTISEYIDFSENEELWKEGSHMFSLGQCIVEETWEEAWGEGREEGREEGMQILVLDNLEEKIPEERILAKLQRRYHLTEEKAKEYYDRFAEEG